MARRITSGLPTPLNADPSTRQFYESVAQAIRALEERFLPMENLAREIQRQGISTGTTPVTPTGVDALSVDACTTPPVPSGFVATAGIGVAILDWDNPFRICSNHGSTRVFRGTSDVFGDASQIGTSSSTIYVDDTVADDTDYWYWIRWVTNDSVPSVGQPTEGVEVHTAVDSEAAISALNDAIQNDPLVNELTDPVDVLVDFDRVQRVRTRAMLLINNAVNSRVTAARAELAGRVSTTEAEITALEASIGGVTLGPEENVFEGATLAETEQALADYGRAHPAWLERYDSNPGFAVSLTWS